MREMNISLFNELTKHHMALQSDIKKIKELDVEHLINFVALTQSCEFMIENLSSVKRFPGSVAGRLELLKLSLEQSSIDGLFIEFGVWQGGSLNFIASVRPDKIIYGFDSFEGLPENWISEHQKGSFNVNGMLPAVRPNVRLVKGWFDETLPPFIKDHGEKCSFLHIDSDLYSSAKTILTVLKDRIVAGTVIVFDEYFSYPGWQYGEYKAFEEFIRETRWGFKYIGYTAGNQLAVKII